MIIIIMIIADEKLVYCEYFMKYIGRGVEWEWEWYW